MPLKKTLDGCPTSSGAAEAFCAASSATLCSCCTASRAFCDVAPACSLVAAANMVRLPWGGSICGTGAGASGHGLKMTTCL